VRSRRHGRAALNGEREITCQWRGCGLKELRSTRGPLPKYGVRCGHNELAYRTSARLARRRRKGVPA
jgi:hypothetical protein